MNSLLSNQWNYLDVASCLAGSPLLSHPLHRAQGYYWLDSLNYLFSLQPKYYTGPTKGKFEGTLLLLILFILSLSFLPSMRGKGTGFMGSKENELFEPERSSPGITE